MTGRDAEYEAFVRNRRPAMVRTARTLTAGDGHLAEDLVQGALVRLYLAWPRVRRTNLDAYARRVLVNGLIDEKRTPFRRREQATERPPDSPVESDMPGEADGALLAALSRLPAGMRAAVVLRHVEDLSVEETADALGCSPGTVKSQTARGLSRLRSLLAESDSAAGEVSSTGAAS